MIEDPQLRTLFRAESAEHLQRIEEGLLRLEHTPDDRPLLEEVFREAHSLKGAARMLGLREVQNVAHGIESALDAARAGRLRIDADQAATQFAHLDRIRELVAIALGEARAAPPADPSTVAQSEDAAPAPDRAPGPRDDHPAAASAGVELPTDPLTADPDPEPRTAAVSRPTPDFRISTLRIPSDRLDALLQLGGELVVSKGRVAQWPAELDRILARFGAGDGSPEAAVQTLAEVREELADLRVRLANDSARLDTIAVQLEDSVRRLRLLPLSTLLDLFPRLVHDLSAELGKPITFQVEGAATVADKHIIEELKAPLTHLLRNAIDHGIEPPAEREQAGKPPGGLIRISVTQSSDTLLVILSDDGRGLDLAAIRDHALRQRLHSAEELAELTEAQVQALVLRPGFSTSPMITDLSGRGVGLDAVRAVVERLRGSLTLDSQPGRGLAIGLRVPVSLTATCALLVREGGETYALPFDDIRFITRLRTADLHHLEGRRCFYRGEQAIPVERLGVLLERAPTTADDTAPLHCVVLAEGDDHFGVLLDEVLGTEDLVVKPTTAPLRRVRNLAGLAVLNSGLVCPVLNRYDLLRGMGRRAGSGTATGDTAAAQPRAGNRRILLAEDSITTRMQERRILEAAGYEVVTAVDGLDAFNKLAQHPFAAVVSDIQMPRMSGLELTEKIRKNRSFAELPVVLVTSLASADDRRRGLEAGADAYISKSEFDQSLLLDCLARLV